jgi:low affinity Fe/Cu permease
MRELYKKSSDHLENLAVRATRWIGSTNSILVHTSLFIVSFVLYFYGVAIDKILLVVTTIVSLEAIYLSIFIQMSVNRQDARLHEVSQDIEEIQEDVEEIQEDVEGIEEDVEEIQEDVEEIQEDHEEEEIITDKEEVTLNHIQTLLNQLAQDVKELKDKHK